MAVVQRMTTYAVCPECGTDAGSVDHLLGQQTETSWYCDRCGQRYRLAFSSDGSVEISKAQGRKITTVDVLVLPPQEKPVYFIVEGMRFEGELSVAQKLRINVAKLRGESIQLDPEPPDPAKEHEHKVFLYESHSCPTNWLKPTMVYFDGDADPHGLIEFVASRDESEFPPDESWGPNDRDRCFVEFIERTALTRTNDAVGQRKRDPI